VDVLYAACIVHSATLHYSTIQPPHKTSLSRALCVKKHLYTVQGDGVNVAVSSGTYTYTATGNQGLTAIVDSVLGSGAFAFTFNTATSGSFQVTAASDPNSKQSGTFTE